MPIKSQAQRGAMYAAKEGKSTLGIPKSVGAEFVASDKPGKLPARVGDEKERRDNPREERKEGLKDMMARQKATRK